MARHVRLSAAARSLSPAKVMRMSDLDAEDVFLSMRWPGDRWQAGLSELRRPDLRRLPPLAEPAALALQGLSR